MFIPPTLATGIAVLVAPPLVGLWCARRVRARRPEVGVANAIGSLPALRWLLVVLLLPVALASVAASPRIAMQLPLALQYWGPSIVWVIVVSAIGGFNFFVVGLGWAERNPERGKVLLAALILSTVFGFMQFHYTRPLAPALVEEVAPDGAILQSSDASCVPASSANVARLLGVVATEPVLAKAMHTTRMFGTSAPQLVVGMREFGIACDMLVLGEHDGDRVPAPAILFVDHEAVGPEGHAVALLGRRGETFEVVDPLSGREAWSRAKLESVWHGIGVSCRLSRGESSRS